jgi:hypothetical protein
MRLYALKLLCGVVLLCLWLPFVALAFWAGLFVGLSLACCKERKSLKEEL